MMDHPYDGPIADRLNMMMDAEIPDDVNIIVITGGTLDGWKDDLSLEGADSVRTDCNQVWKMKGAHDGQRRAEGKRRGALRFHLLLRLPDVQR